MASSSGTKLESEIAKELDLSVIRYSRVWEDHRVLSRALQIQPEDVVLSITRSAGPLDWGWEVQALPFCCSCSAGDNVLNLLLDEPKKIGNSLFVETS